MVLSLAEQRTVTVTGSSTVTIDGVELSRLTLNYSQGTMFDAYVGQWVTERLGSIRYLFPWPLSTCDGTFVVALRCYEDPEFSWLNPQFTQCDFSTGIDEADAVPSLLMGSSIVNAGEPIAVKTTPGSAVELLQSDGRCLHRTVALGPITELRTDAAGMCLVRVRNAEGTRTQRVIVK